MKKLTICLLVLTAFSIALVSLSCVEQVQLPVLYGDLRDYYPFGLWVKAKKLDYEPVDYKILANDTYIEQAIDSGNLTWVQQDDPNSTFIKAGTPQYILWSPNGNYYLIDQTFTDGIPESWNKRSLPSPMETAKLLAIPWIALLVAAGIQRRIDAKEKA